MSKKFKLLLYILFIAISLTGYTQNTLQFTKDTISPNATLEDVSWIQGHWKGEAFGGIIEEIWSPPLGDSMMFVFKLVVDNKVVFYEAGGIRQVDKTLFLQFKHFHGDFKGWEEKDETVDFRLVKIENNKVFFEGFTFEKISDTEINLYVVIDHKDGKSEEVKFNYKK
jgi:hypothetical protein